MDLRRYLEDAGMTQEQFAARVGTTQPTISLCVTHEKQISLGLALIIQHVTLGKVRAEDLPISCESRGDLGTIKALARSGAFQ